MYMKFRKDKKSDPETAAPDAVDDAASAKEEKPEVPDKEEKKPEETGKEPTKEKTPEEQIEELRLALAESQAKYLYLQAEYQNYRKRASREVGDARLNAVADTLLPFLNVADFLRMADTAAAQSDNLDSLKQGLCMIIAQFDKALDELGVKRMTSVGEKFDPALHDAVSNQVSDTVPEGVIISEWNCGYTMGERQLRAPRVIVSSGPAKEEPAPEEPEKKDSGETENSGEEPESWKIQDDRK